MNSFNHYAYGAVGSWLYEKVAGLDTDEAEPGYKKLVLRPRILEGLTHARATLQTPYGTAESHWEKKKKSLVWRITVPPNATARVYLPVQAGQKVTESDKSLEKAAGVSILSEDSLELISGTYEFEIK
jgi:alpha-L-rhamnosidase